MISNCPACGAPLNLEGSPSKATCPFCGNAFNVDMASVQPALQKTDPNQAAYEPPSADSGFSVYTPPSAEPPQIDTDPLYNPPIEIPGSQSSYNSSSSPRIPFPQQTYNSARQTAQSMYGTIAARGKNFLVIALVAMLAMLGGCCFCLVMTVRWITGG
ncbi:MAG TPA: hypothetical protein VFF78_01965 [Anaerolineaceae bacterium]|nr:hypothetical protein [Anaerolineaceae bacterium]